MNPKLGRRQAIGIVGAGGIVAVGHLPAYRAAGYDVVGIADRNVERARALARQFGITRVFRESHRLIACEEVDVVDIAVVPEAQPAIALDAIRTRKPVLCQKPFAISLEEAERVVAAAAAAGVPLAVNQQMRWAPVIRRIKLLLDSGLIGIPERLSFEISINTDWSEWDFLTNAPRLEFLYHSVHYLDALRYLLGEPERVTASARRSHRQTVTGETGTVSIVEFPGTLATVSVEHNDAGTPLHRAEIRVVCSEGTVVGEIGLLYDYPDGRADRIAVAHASSALAEEETLPGRWFPDAFAGPMSELLAAASGGGEPLTSGRDNLGTLALVLAAYESVETGASVVLDGPLRPR